MRYYLFVFLFLQVSANYPRIGDDCVIDDNCYTPWENCNSETLKCEHKDAWKFLGLEWFGLFFTIVWIFGCNAAGMGGGGTMVPIIRMLFNFPANQAIYLSNITVFISGLLRYLFDFKKRHPLKKDLKGNSCGTLLEYSIAIIIMPMGVVGSACGSIVSLILPEPLIIGVLTFVLVFITISTSFKLKGMIKAESEAKNKKIEAEEKKEIETKKEQNRVPIVNNQFIELVDISQEKPVYEPTQDVLTAQKDESQANEEESSRIAKVEKQIKSESTHLSPKLFFCLGMIVVLFLISLFRGNGKDPSVVNVTKCQPIDHIFLTLLILIGFVCVFAASVWTRRDFFYKKKIGYTFVKGEIEMTMPSIFKLGLIGFMSGFLQSGFGVGSAFVVSPALFMFEQHPATASATGMFIAMLNTASASIVLFIFQKMNLEYAASLCVFTAIGTIPGIMLQHYLVKKTGRPSMTVKLLLWFIIFSVFANPLISIVAMAEKHSEGLDIMGFNSYCN